MVAPKISVIVPVYKAEKFLHRCVDSILAQSYTDFELLLVEDGSPDNSGVICDEYAAKDSRVRVFHKENGGVSSARNLGLDNAKGEWITFCDADDYVAPDWLSAYGKAMAENIDLAIQGFYIIDEGRAIKNELPQCQGYTIEDKRELITSLMRHGMYGYLWVKLFRRQLIEQHSIRFDTNSAFREDAQFFSEFMVHVKKNVCLDDVGYYYILPPSGKEYNGDLNYSLFPICQSLDVIFDKKIPLEVSRIYYSEVKSIALEEILLGTLPSLYHLDLYKRMSETLGYEKGVKKQIVNYLILNCHKFPVISRNLLKWIRIVTKQYKWNR